MLFFPGILRLRRLGVDGLSYPLPGNIPKMIKFDHMNRFLPAVCLPYLLVCTSLLDQIIHVLFMSFLNIANLRPK